MTRKSSPLLLICIILLTNEVVRRRLLRAVEPPGHRRFDAVGILLCIPVFYNLLVWKRRNPVVIALLFIVFWISVYFSSISAGNPFMYFSF